ncbi:MAG: nucleotidyl transferase AbiEii/AbiGii toxin family protein [Candidatus Marsarchaeota archaeon]|nr:nucleotidyl transferase AbiEii/AbiGii toxin family protein [Candidatus Marsarchaeota archaeon]
MMDEYGLMDLSDRFKDTRQLERDYLLLLLLHEIYSVFTRELVFKGGTALKYFYSLNRFSEDLDFSYAPPGYPPDRKLLDERINTAADRVSAQYQITEIEHRANKADKEIVGMNYEIRIRGPLNQRTGQLQNIKIDVSLRNDLIIKPELRYLSPVYPDITTFSLPVMDVNEILAEKIASIIERSKMRDIYDAYYLLVIRKLRYDEDMVVEKMHKRKERFDREALAEKLSAARNKMKWRSELAYIVNPLPDSTEAISELERIVDV